MSCRVAIAVSRFNTLITERLLAAAIEGLSSLGVHPDRIVVASVPGSFELPYAARRFAETGRFDAVVCLGCVIKGETGPQRVHQPRDGCRTRLVGQETGVPAIFGVVTTNRLEQALARAEEGSTNKG